MCTAYLPVVTNKRVLCVWNSAFTQREAHTRCEKGNPKYFRGVMRPKLFIFGLGYVGLELGLEAQRIGWSVSGSVRSAEKAQLISARSGIDAHTFDLDEHYSGLDDAGRSALMEATPPRLEEATRALQLLAAACKMPAGGSRAAAGSAAAAAGSAAAASGRR